MVVFSAEFLISLVQMSFIRLSPATSAFCCCCCHSAFWSIAGQSTNIPDYFMHSYSRIRSIQCTLIKGDPIMSSLRKQPTFRDTTTDFFAKWHLGNERRNSIPTTRHYPDMGSASDWMKQISNLSEAPHSAQFPFWSILLRGRRYRVCSRDVTAAILMFLSNETTPMSVSQTSPSVVKLFTSVNAFFCSNEFS